MFCGDGVIEEEGEDTGMDDFVGEDGVYDSDCDDDESMSPIMKEWLEYKSVDGHKDYTTDFSTRQSKAFSLNLQKIISMGFK